ncbi:MAG: class I SAM-dependent methyltransferase [Actinomycetota bacterium]
MHPAVRDFVSEIARRFEPRPPYALLEIGSLHVNGGIRDLWPGAEPYIGLDISPGQGVDIVADARSWIKDRNYNVVVATEVLEHVDNWEQVVHTAHEALAPGGLFVMTCATTGRPPHGAHGSPEPLNGEYYSNVGLGEFAQVVDELGFAECELRQTTGFDLQFYGFVA